MDCPVVRSRQVPPLVDEFRARHVGYAIASVFTLVSILASAWLVQKHLKWYSCKHHQRLIIRLLFFPPIYASITLASYVSDTTYLFLVRDVYASIVLASFFSLVLEYLAGPRLGRLWVEAPASTERAAVVRGVFSRIPMRPDPTNAHEPLKWIFPFCLVPVRPKDGLAYLDWMKWGVLQYCIVRPGTTLAAVILEQLDLYCESSWSWRWGHVYVVTIASVSAAVAMYSLIQLYTTIRQDLKHCKPRLKLFTVISLVFLTFWQSTLLEGITSLDLVPNTEYLTARDITLGFSALLQTFEMMCLAFIHINAFSYGPYKQLARRPESRSLHPDTRQTDLPVSARRRVVNLVRAFRFTRTAYRTREADERVLERSFMRTGGYKGLPQDDKRPKARARPSIPGLRYSPFPTPCDEQEDVSPLRARADDVAPNGPSAEYVASNAEYVDPSAEYVVPTLEHVGPSVEYVAPNAEYADPNVEYTPCPDAEYAPSPRPPPLAPAPPPKGAYVPARGPAWSGDGVITPPRTPVLTSPPGSSHPPQLASIIPSHTPASDGPVPPVISTSRRIGSVYVGGARGSEFFTPRPDPGPISPRSPVSPGLATTPVSLRTPISAVSSRSPAPFTPRSPEPLLPRAKGSLRPDTHISPSSARVLAQTSPLFQQSFVDAQVPLSPVSPRLVRVSEEEPRLVRVSEEDTGLLRVSEEGTRPRTSGETQRHSGFTLPRWASATPTHIQWPSNTPTHSQWPSGTTFSRRTSANTVDPPSPTRGRPVSVSDDVEPPSSSRDDSLLRRVFSGASRTRDSERTSILSLRTGECEGSDEGAVHPVRTVSFRSGAPVLVRLGERRDSISSPSLVSSSCGNRRESDPSTPSSISTRPSPATASPYATLPSPPQVARPLRRMSANLQLRVPRGPRAQPRAPALPAPLSPARYQPWRSTATRSAGLGHVSSVHGTVSHWNPLQPPSTGSLERLAGRGAAPEYTAMSSLSSLSNSDDPNPTVSRRDS